MSQFPYFADPYHFSYLLDETQPCDCCGAEAVFDASLFSGIAEIDAICADCLAAGKLKALDIETNEPQFSDNITARDTIRYCTPKLPSWQGIFWPCIDGEYPRFERIASQADFDDIDDFKCSFSAATLAVTDINHLWQCMSDTPIDSIAEGGDISVYLFSLNGRKHCLWDAN